MPTDPTPKIRQAKGPLVRYSPKIACRGGHSRRRPEIPGWHFLVGKIRSAAVFPRLTRFDVTINKADIDRAILHDHNGTLGRRGHGGSRLHRRIASMAKLRKHACVWVCALGIPTATAAKQHGRAGPETRSGHAADRARIGNPGRRAAIAAKRCGSEASVDAYLGIGLGRRHTCKKGCTHDRQYRVLRLFRRITDDLRIQRTIHKWALRARGQHVIHGGRSIIA